MDLFELSSQPEGLRDTLWEQHFLQAFVSGHIELASETPQQGPDGWPYMLVKTSKKATEPTRNLLHWASEKGVGIVVNADKQLPDFIFTYGMICSFRSRGLFVASVNEQVQPGQVVYKEGQKVITGNPNETYLPAYARKVLRQFLLDQGLKAPKFLVVSLDGKNYDLVFSLESFNNPPKEEHKGILEALSWFLPNDYSLVLAPEKGLPEFCEI